MSIIVDATAPDGLTFTDPAHGTVVQAGNMFMYTPDPNYNGPDTLVVTGADGEARATGTIAITVTPVNDTPVAVDDSMAAEEDQDASITAAALTANDTDVDDDALVVTAVGDAEHGTVTLNQDTVTFRSDANFAGTATFSYSGGTTTANHTLRRKCSAHTNDTDPTNAYDPTVQWDGFPVGTFSDLGAYSCP